MYTIMTMHGTIELAAKASTRLKKKRPILYALLYKNNIDLLYFIVEDKIDAYENMVLEEIKRET